MKFTTGTYSDATPRKIVQLAVASTPDPDFDNVLYALCDDGTVWELSRKTWNKMPAIPQDDEEAA